MRRVYLGAFFLALALVWAQTYTASIRGTVVDASQAGIPSATIAVTEVNRNVVTTVKSDSSGRYELLTLPPGRYTLEAEAPGFRRVSQPPFELEVQQAATINIELTVGEVTTNVEVLGQAPLLSTAGASLGQVIENKFILTMPLSSRNPMDLVGLTPGLVPPAGAAGLASGVNFISNGVRNNTSDVLLDGALITGLAPSSVSNMQYTPVVDLVQEFKVQTNFLNAEFGSTGGTIINMVTKSGTNQLHGSVYEFRLDNAYNANSWFSNKSGGHLAGQKRNIFGGSAGGPVEIPKLYNGRNRTFFFYDFQGTLNHAATSTTSTVPTAAERTGDFSGDLNANGSQYVIYNPFNLYTPTTGGTQLRQPFPGNIIPQSMINPIAGGINQDYPLPTSSGNLYTHVNNWYAQGINVTSAYQMDAKIDQYVGSKQRFAIRYSVNWNPTSQPANLIGNVAGSQSTSSGRTQNSVVEYTRTQSATTVITVRLGLTRVATLSAPASLGFNPQTLGFPAAVGAGPIQSFPYWAPSGYVAIGGGQYAFINNHSLQAQPSGSITKVAGAHTIKAGGELRRQYLNFSQPSAPDAAFTFSRNITGMNPVVSNANQGDGFASELLGWGDNSGQAKWYDQPAAMATGYVGTYVQDDWRITPKLTLNIGLRYDFQMPRTERYNRLDWFNYNAPSPISGQVPGWPGGPLNGAFEFASSSQRSPFNGDYHDIQPRIGIAYALGNKMSIRAGYGIYYSQGRQGQYGWTGLSFRSISSIQWSRDSSYTQFATLQNPYPFGLTPVCAPNASCEIGMGTNTFNIDERNPQDQQWSLSIQRAVPGNGVVEVNYSASKGTYLYLGDGDLLGNRNKLYPTNWALGRTKLQTYVPNPFYGVITNPLSNLSLPTVQYQQLLLAYPEYTTVGGYLSPPNIGVSSYQSVQFKYEKRFSKGLGLLAHYTISKNLGDTDYSSSDQQGNSSSSLQNWVNLRQEKSLSSFDIPQRLVTSFNYQLPFGRNRAIGRNMNKVLNGAVGGWEISSTLTFSSGFPIFPTLAANNLLSGVQRPNLLCDPSTSGPAVQRINGYFNTACFSAPGLDTYGSAGRSLSTYRAYGVRTGNMTLMKNFTFTESKSLQIRLEAYNFTNTPNFSAPNASFGNSSFGLITATSIPARSVQMVGKLYF